MHFAYLLGKDNMVVTSQSEIDTRHLLAEFLVVWNSHVSQSYYQVTLFIVPQVMSLVLRVLYEVNVVELTLVILCKQADPLLFGYSK